MSVRLIGSDNYDDMSRTQWLNSLRTFKNYKCLNLMPLKLIKKRSQIRTKNPFKKSLVHGILGDGSDARISYQCNHPTHSVDSR